MRILSALRLFHRVSVARYRYSDAQSISIVEGTANIQKTIIALDQLDTGKKGSQPLNPHSAKSVGAIHEIGPYCRENPMPQALADLKVLDLLPGPGHAYCSMMLGDLGARSSAWSGRVWEMKPPLGPPGPGAEAPITSAPTGTRRACRRPEKEGGPGDRPPPGRAERRPAGEFPSGDLARMKLGYEDIKALNPGIIYASVTGYGQNGPYRDQPGFDFNPPGPGRTYVIIGRKRPPMKVGVAIVDITAGSSPARPFCRPPLPGENGRDKHVDLAPGRPGCLAGQSASNYLVRGRFPAAWETPTPISFPTNLPGRGRHLHRLGVGNETMAKFCKLAGSNPSPMTPVRHQPREWKTARSSSPPAGGLLRKNPENGFVFSARRKFPWTINTSTASSRPQVWPQMLVEMEHPKVASSSSWVSPEIIPNPRPIPDPLPC